MGDPLDDALRDVMHLLQVDEQQKVKKGVRNPVVEQREAGGHLGEPQREDYELPRSVRQLIGGQTPPHLLTVRRTR
jgi:hypothetical protein